MKTLQKSFFAFLFTTLFALPHVSAAVLDVSELTLVSTFEADSLFNLAGVDSWNGAPLSPANQPPSIVLPLESDINLYVRNAETNKLYVVVTNVVSTVGATWFGTAFVNVTQSGAMLSLPLLSGGFLGGTPGISGAFAIAGQTLLSPPNVITPIDRTDGYEVNSVADEFLIKTIDPDADMGFVGNNFIFIDSASRLRNGGVFELSFDPAVNLLDIIDYGAMALQTRYGNGSQYIQGLQTFAYLQPQQGGGAGPGNAAVPEPSTWVLLTLGLSLFVLVKKNPYKPLV